MDYDDSDFESQNLHLASEGSSKFPPVLRPYALPKFDFDESLQANLRFDSLVETEVFLGIESNEDNQWIDAFSRGGSNIEFSSTAAGTCSISRHDNVWSEATSSESVEMLLKSVGQGEYNPRQTVIQESDACDELACLAKQMDSNPKPDDRNEFKVDDTDLQPPGGTNTSFYGLKENVGMEQSQAGVSHSHESDLSIDVSSGILEPNDACQNIDIPISEGSPTFFSNDKDNNTNQREVETVADDLHHGEMHESSALAVETDITESSMQNMVNEQQGPQQTQTNNQNSESSMTNQEAVVVTQTLDENAVGADTHHPDKSVFSIPTQETLEGGSVVKGSETGLSSLEDSMGMGTIAVSDLQKEERCSEDIWSCDLSRANASKNLVLLKDVAIADQSAPDTCTLPKVSIKDDSVFEGQVAEVSNSSYGICPNLQQTVDVMEKKTYSVSNVPKENESLNTGGDHMDTGILSSKSEASMFPAEENSISVVSEGNNDNMLGGFSVSTNSSIVGESTQICVNNEPDRQSDLEKFDQDDFVNDEEKTKICSDMSEMHSDVALSHLGDKGVVSSLLTACSMQSELTTSSVSINVKPVNNSASQVVSENISLTSCEIMNDTPPSEVVSTHGATGDNNIQRVTTVELSSAEGKEEIDMKIAEEAGIPTIAGSSEQETAPCPVKETEKLHTSGHLICDVASDSKLGVGMHDAAKIGEPQKTIDDKVTQECTKEIRMPPVLCESSEKQGDGVTISVIEDDKETLQEIHDKSPSKELGDVLLGNKDCVSTAPLPDSCVKLPETGSFPANTNCSTPSTFRSPFQTEKDENRGKASANQNPPASDLKNCGTNNTLTTAQVLKGNTASKDERSSTPEVNFMVDLSMKDTVDVNTEDVGKRHSAPVITTSNASIALEESPSTSVLGPSKTKTVANISRGSPQISDREATLSASKATPERKTRRSSNKAAGKESARRGRVKGATPARQSERDDKSTKVSLSSSSGFKLMQSNEVQQYGHIDSSSSKPFVHINTSTSSLPDLNTSTSSPVLFHQPFTDLQQVQLRAQIFVYGALIQGTTPDEAHMISAFGGTDGGRSIWENVWRVCIERQHSQKSHPINPETPLQSRSVARTSDSTVKQSALQGKGISSPLGRGCSKATPTITTPLIPLSSPLWSLPTLSCDSQQSSALARGSVVDYSQAHTPLHHYQSPPPRNFLGHNTSWISQAPLRGPWIGSATPAPDNSTHLSASPASDTIKLGSVKGSSLPPSSSIKNVTPGPPASSTGLQSIFVGTSSQLDANIVTVPPAQHSSDPKPKKRKKAVPSEDLGQKPLQSLTPAVASRASTSVAVVTPVGNVPISTIEKSVVSVSPLADQPKNDQSVKKRILSDESLMKVKEARLHAEEASAHSAAAVNHSLELWSQLDKHKSSGLMPDIEAKLANAAVAVAAAAAVAKAAAAAANVASNAALQAKLMADEALIFSGHESSCQIYLSEGMSNLGKATPASILKGASGTNSSSSIIGAAKEASRRRVEAASYARKRAENMDAIVKAAELAAEAVSQAGKIVTMGDPLPLSNLVEAGPEGCWKTFQESSQQVGLLKGTSRGPMNADNVGDRPEISQISDRDISSEGMGKQIAASKESPFHKVHNEMSLDHMRSIDDISSIISINENSSNGSRGHKVSNLVNLIDTLPASGTKIQASLTVGNGSENLEENNIKEGSHVEVFKDGKGFKTAWFTANVLSLKDGKAYVCYNMLVADEGPLKEWVSLEGEGDKPPRIRAAHSLTSFHNEGTRKRPRAAMVDYWSIGDRVDAWIQESWQEGVITDKKKKDKTFTVHFPASGETSVVGAWHLRPSLVWNDGKWIETPKVGVNDSPTNEGDTPHEKRPKLGSHAQELVKGKGKISKSTDAVESTNPIESRLLKLSEDDKVFNVGKNNKNEMKPDAHRLARSGLQKEGPRVIFGVPKPGKKRKFMEVSKHYVADGRSRNDDGNDSVKLANSTIPQASGSRGWKNSSIKDTKEKPGADFKPTSKSGKLQSVLGRAIPLKQKPLSNSHTNDLTSRTERIKDSSSHFNNASQSENQVERASSHSETTGARPTLYSSLASSTDSHPTKKPPTSRVSKGKLAPAGGRSGKVEVEQKAVSGNSAKSTSEEVPEPRRSNRKIQPTSRLLEGLQSSLIISKIPSGSHDKGHKNQNRNTSRGNNHG